MADVVAVAGALLLFALCGRYVRACRWLVSGELDPGEEAEQ
jgi:hypothetical protein